MGYRCRKNLVIMLRFPQIGKVKTRLAAGIGGVSATRLYRHMVAARINQLYQPRLWNLYLAYSPDIYVHQANKMLSQYYREAIAIAQGGGDLGSRIWRALSTLSGDNIIIGSDIINIEKGHIANAFNKLASSNYVIGPGDDGGYWLIGASGIRSRAKVIKTSGSGLLKGVRWSSEHTLTDTLNALSGSNEKIAIINTLNDLDTAADMLNMPMVGRHAIGRRVGQNQLPSTVALTQ